MQLLLAALLSIVLFFCSGCGNVFVRGVIQPGPSTINGFVSVLQITVVNGATVTFVTFLAGGASSTLGFCGDQRRRFPINQNVRTEFNSGTPCNSIVTIVII